MQTQNKNTITISEIPDAVIMVALLATTTNATFWMRYLDIVEDTRCPKCEGAGRVSGRPCPVCKGRGEIFNKEVEPCQPLP